MAYSIPKIEKESRDIIKDFGYLKEKDFIKEAVREKLMELKKLQFFVISEKIRKGLEKKGLEPIDVLKKIKS